MKSSVLLIVAALVFVPLASVSAETSEAAPEGAVQAESPTAPEGAAVEAVEGPAPETAAPGEGEAEAAAADAGGEPVAGSDAVAAESPADAAELAAGTEPETAPEGTPGTAEAVPAPRELGAIGYDVEGRPGRIHLVVSGDTLWDISDAYLGTPWVWPSIWQDNEDVENPHRIYPGDRIWITPTEMRRLTAEEAEALLAGKPAMPEPPPAAPEEPQWVEPALPVEPEQPPQWLVSSRESVGLISEEQLGSAASIVSSVPDRVMLAQTDLVYVGLGEGRVTPGEQFTIFRNEEKVYDPDSGRLLGYHVEHLGWLEVTEVHEETALAEIQHSASEILMGDRVVPREVLPLDVPIQPSPEGVEGKISFFPKSRVLMGQIDYVYLNRGSLDGLEVGSPLEVYRVGWIAAERARSERVHVPDRVIAQMLVVRAEPESSVALVTHTQTELELGDRFRAGHP